MAIDITRHPCFNIHMRHRYGRVHLPVAPKCNIQCKFCNRKYDCMNESRPGVTSAVLSPKQALHYLQEIVKRKPETSVVGIAGPGDPFANPEQTMETLRLVRDYYPEMILCVATNGMNLSPYVNELADLQVSHVTVTVNAVDPQIGSEVYRWMRDGTKVMRGEAGARRLLEKQLEAIGMLKKSGVTVKVNAIIIPGINDHHIEDIAVVMKGLGVDILNCMPLLPAKGSDFEDLQEPSPEMIAEIREKAKSHIPQMTHCARCRADAAGKLGEELDAVVEKLLRGCCTTEKRAREKVAPYVAVATMEGVLVNQHLGNAFDFSIFKNGSEGPQFVERRSAPIPGGGDKRWHELGDVLHDCHTVLVQYAGKRPREILAEKGVEVIAMEGLIDVALREVFAGRPVPAYMTSKAPKSCGSGCGGSGGGCAA